MRKYVAVLLLLTVPVWGLSDPQPQTPPSPPVKLPQPPIPVPPPSPPPVPATLAPLGPSQLYAFDSDIKCICLTSLNGIAKVTEDAGPMKIRAKFVWGNGVETRTFTKKFVYSVEAVSTGKCELLVVPVGVEAEASIARQQLDCSILPIPPPEPPKPPPGTYTISSSDGAVIPFTPNTDLDAAKAAADAYVKSHPTAVVTIKDSTGGVVYTAGGAPPEPPDPFEGEKGAAPVFRTLIKYESADLTKYPKEQAAIFASPQIRAYLKSHCGTVAGVYEFRVWDKDVDTANEAPVWQKVMKRPSTAMPWMVIGNGKTGFEGPMPSSVDETLKLLQKYGGQ